METILYNISQVLGITIIHSLWQGLFVYFLLRLVLMFAGQLSASKKYLLAATSLLAIVGWFVYTLVNEINSYNWLAVKPGKLSAMPIMLELPSGIQHLNDQTTRYYYSIEKYLPYITIVYVAGLIFNTIRLLVARKKTKSITQNMSIDIQLQHLVNTFSGVLNIGTKVKVGLSRMVDVPCMVGYFKPVILLPFTLATYLSAEEIEAILLHELAHIKRNDYLVNMVQQVLSILLFFNPCALLINRIINEERENSCDDLVVKATADPVNYAKALLKLEQTRQNDWKLALAATGKKYHLLNRIQRIMKTKKPTTSVRPALVATLILTIGISCIALLNPQIAQGKISVKAILPAVNHLLADTTNKSADKNNNHSKNHNKKTKHSADLRDDENNAASDPDKKLQELNADVQKKSEALNNYYNSDEFKSAQKALEKKSAAMGNLYNSPEMQKKQEELAKASADFAKSWSDNPQMKDLTKQMGEMGKNMGIYFGSPEFKKLNEELEKKYGVSRDSLYYNKNNDHSRDENYKKYEAELQSRLPAEIKHQTDQLKIMGEQMSAHYDSPEFKEQNQHLKELAEDMKKAYSSSDFKRQQAEMQRLAEQMTSYQNNPDMKKAHKELEESIRKMTNYINSAEYRKHLEDMVKSATGDEKIERPEKQEKPEKPEKDEAPEN